MKAHHKLLQVSKFKNLMKLKQILTKEKILKFPKVKENSNRTIGTKEI